MKEMPDGQMPNLSSNQFDQIKQALEAINKGAPNESGQNFNQMFSNLQNAAASRPDPKAAATLVGQKMTKIKLVKQMRVTLQQQYFLMYYRKEVRETLMGMEIQFNRLENYNESPDLSRCIRQMKQFLKKIEKPREGKVPLNSLKVTCEKIKNTVDEAYAIHKEKFEQAKSIVDVKKADSSLAECKKLKMYHLIFRDLTLLVENAKHVDFNMQRIEGFPDDRFGENFLNIV